MWASALNSILAGFLVGSGTYHQGGFEAAMRELQILAIQNDVAAYIRRRIQAQARIAGFGHRFYNEDTRARVLMELCDQHHFGGEYVKVVRQADEILRIEKGIHMNIDGAGGAILLDLGFPVEIAPLIVLIGRGPMFAVAYLERLREGNKPFPIINVSDVFPEGGKRD